MSPQALSISRRVVPAFALLCLAAAPVEPWVGRVTWTTYLHEGPGREYQVEDEIDTATQVEVLACRDGWCRVNYTGSIGYLPRDLLTPTGEPNSVPAPPGPNCFEARRSGYEGGHVFEYCPR